MSKQVPKIGHATFACGAVGDFEYFTEMERRAIVGNIERRRCPACTAGIPPEQAITPDTLPPDTIDAGGALLIERPERRGFQWGAN